MTLAEIRQFILDKITSTGTGFINGANLRTALTEMVDKITAQTFLTGWLAPNTINSIVSNSDDAYRTGKSIFGRTTDDTTGAMVQVEGAVSMRRLWPTGFSATITANTGGLGTGGSATILGGSDMSGVLRIRTGSNPAVNALMATVNFAVAYPYPPRVVILTPANQAAAREYSKVLVSTTTTTSFIIYGSNSTALTANFDYDFFYLILQ